MNPSQTTISSTEDWFFTSTKNPMVSSWPWPTSSKRRSRNKEIKIIEATQSKRWAIWKRRPNPLGSKWKSWGWRTSSWGISSTLWRTEGESIYSEDSRTRGRVWEWIRYITWRRGTRGMCWRARFDNMLLWCDVIIAPQFRMGRGYPAFSFRLLWWTWPPSLTVSMTSLVPSGLIVSSNLWWILLPSLMYVFSVTVFPWSYPLESLLW